MFRSILRIGALCLALGCSATPSESLVASTPETYVGTWKSITPGTEFMRLTVTSWSLSSRSGDLGAQLALSGLRWDGWGRIENDSLLLQMSLPHAASEPRRALVAHSRDGRGLFVRWQTEGAPIELTFIRE